MSAPANTVTGSDLSKTYKTPLAIATNSLHSDDGTVIFLVRPLRVRELIDEPNKLKELLQHGCPYMFDQDGGFYT